MQREVEGLKAKATLGVLAKAADVKAGQAAEVALADARRVIAQERRKAGMLERDLAGHASPWLPWRQPQTRRWPRRPLPCGTCRLPRSLQNGYSDALLRATPRAAEAAGEL